MRSGSEPGTELQLGVQKERHWQLEERCSLLTSQSMPSRSWQSGTPSGSLLLSPPCCTRAVLLSMRALRPSRARGVWGRAAGCSGAAAAASVTTFLPEEGMLLPNWGRGWAGGRWCEVLGGAGAVQGKHSVAAAAAATAAAIVRQRLARGRRCCLHKCNTGVLPLEAHRHKSTL